MVCGGGSTTASQPEIRDLIRYHGGGEGSARKRLDPARCYLHGTPYTYTSHADLPHHEGTMEGERVQCASG